MSSLNDRLRGLFGPDQLSHLERVRDAMLEDPTVLDNHKKEKVRGEEVSSTGEKGLSVQNGG